MVFERVNECSEPCFDSPKDEALYWKELTQDYMLKLQDVREEFEEFQEGSRELETELEAQLEQYEQRVKDLVNTKSVLEEENEILKEKLESTHRETYLQITSLQDENAQIKGVKDEMTKYIRELEQTNDDLERSKRATICSLEEFDTRLNTAIERNAFLENELEDKEELMITVQRLKDEAKDLKGELGVTSQRHHSFESKVKLSRTTTVTDGKPQEPLTPNRKIFEMDKNKTNITHLSSVGAPLSRVNSNPMTPSARISALNIVSDLLRKVGALESKLASCRNFVQDHPRNGKTQHFVHGITPIAESPKSKTKNLNNSTKGSSTISGLVKVNV